MLLVTVSTDLYFLSYDSRTNESTITGFLEPVLKFARILLFKERFKERMISNFFVNLL